MNSLPQTFPQGVVRGAFVRNASRHSKGNSAFTLLEVVLAVTILASLSATVYQVVAGSVQSAALLAENQRQNDRVRTLFEIFRSGFQSFPGGGTVELEVIEEEPLIQELTLGEVPAFLQIGANPASRGDTTISIREQPLDQENPERGILYTVAMTREDFAPPEDELFGLGLRVESDGVGGSANSGIYTGGMPDDDFSADEEGRYWFPLLKNIRAIEWGIYDPDEDDFMPEWTSDADRPKLIEINILLEGWDTWIRAVFSVADAPTSEKPTSVPEEVPGGGEQPVQPGNVPPTPAAPVPGTGGGQPRPGTGNGGDTPRPGGGGRPPQNTGGGRGGPPNQGGGRGGPPTGPGGGGGNVPSGPPSGGGSAPSPPR